jgi:hypothetical protein
MYYILIASIPDKNIKNMSNKALVRIHKDIFLNHQIKNLLKTNKKAKIFIICAFESKKILDNIIKHKRVNCINHTYTEYSNVGESLKNIISHIPDNSDISIINISMVIDPGLIKNLKLKDSAVIVSQSAKFKSKIGCTIDHNNNVEFVFYDLPNKICEYLYINKKDNGIFKWVIKNHIKNNMYLFEIINELIHHNIQINTIKLKTNIMHFNSIDQLTNIKNLFRKIENASAI